MPEIRDPDPFVGKPVMDRLPPGIPDDTMPGPAAGFRRNGVGSRGALTARVRPALPEEKTMKPLVEIQA
jgi:hypothetical protein